MTETGPSRLAAVAAASARAPPPDNGRDRLPTFPSLGKGLSDSKTPAPDRSLAPQKYLTTPFPRRSIMGGEVPACTTSYKEIAVKRLWMALACLVVVIGLLSAAGCSNTWHGFGKDMETTGKDMQGKD
jgi:predicted small secreted protein